MTQLVRVDTLRVMAIIQDTPGGRLYEARRAASKSRNQLATDMGCATSAISNHEHGINGIRAPTAARYAELLGVTPQWILYGDGESSEVQTVAKPQAANRSEGVSLTQVRTGHARLQVNKVVPFDVALRVLALIEGVEP